MDDRILPDWCISGRELVSIDGVVVHYFSALHVEPERKFNLDVCRDLFLDLNRPRQERALYMMSSRWPDDRMYASAHVLIGRDGETWKLVEYDKEAYHAGASILNGRRSCNTWTLGVELVGSIDSGFSRAQYFALVELLLALETEYGILRENVAGHDAVRHAAIQAGSKRKPKYDPSGRKDGKGDNFNWFYLGKLWNDARGNPAGVVGLESLEDIIEADPNSG